MAKELLIVFVYDCEICKKEEDDPDEAIVYFYPTWVNRDQRHALCSQLMGVAQFCSSTFASPKIISLQSGKFSIKRLSRYYLCVGTDRNIPDIVLETRSMTLYRLIRLFHYDIEAIQTSLNLSEDDSLTLSDKLTDLFHVYMPILQYATNIFGNIPTFKLPKSASSLFLQAMHILQDLQSVPGVLGGVLLQQNKVIATQLSHQLTKQFVVTDPFRIKLPVDSLETKFHMPVGVQLLSVFVDSAEVNDLREALQNNAKMKQLLPTWKKEYQEQQESEESESGICVTGAVGLSGSGMKRSLSMMKTVLEEVAPEVPERPVEDAEEELPVAVRSAVKARHLVRISSVRPSDFVLHRPEPRPLPATTDSVSLTSFPLTFRYYSLGLPRPEADWAQGRNGWEEVVPPTQFYNTLADPSLLLFRPNGLPASSSLLSDTLTSHQKPFCPPLNKKVKQKSLVLENGKDKKDTRRERPKRDFKLPLNSNLGKDVGSCLTPLMAKLSLLASEEDVGLGTPLGAPRCRPETGQSRPRPTPAPRPPSPRPSDPHHLTHTALYVYGNNDTVILLLLELSTASDPDRIHSLWERCVKDVSDYEERVEAVAMTGVLGQPEGEQTYSYLVVDPGWGPAHRAGPYHPHHIEILTHLHHSLNNNPSFTDITLRTEDSVCYGSQLAGRQVYYQEVCSSIAGLPPPTDAMGVVPLKARRRLQRDHNLLLL